jgi:CRISPR-associated endonuclease Csn1
VPVKGGGSNETEWYVLDGSAKYLWSLYSNSFVEIAKSDGDVIEGYFRSLDRKTGAITISPDMNAAEICKGIGVKTLSSFNKFTVDRLGCKFKVRRELRTWRGKACT